MTILKNPPFSSRVWLHDFGRALAQKRIGDCLTQDELARAAGVGKRTVERIEDGQSVQTANLIRVMHVLNILNQLTALKQQEAPTPMQLLKAKKREPKRVPSRRKRLPKTESPWKWGDVA